MTEREIKNNRLIDPTNLAEQRIFVKKPGNLLGAVRGERVGSLVR